MTNHLEAIRQAVNENRMDWDRRRVYADALEEAGQHDAAVAQWWMASRRKRPCLTWRDLAAWFDGSRPHPDGLDPFSDLPEPLFRLLEGPEAKEAVHVRFREYPSDAAAEDALAQVLKYLAHEGGVIVNDSVPSVLEKLEERIARLKSELGQHRAVEA